MQRTVARYLRRITPDTLTHLDLAVLPVLQRLARSFRTEAGVPNFVCLMTQAMV